MFLILAGIVVKQIIPWRQQTIDRDEAWCKNLTEEVKSLKTELKHCEVECEKKSRALQEELWGMRRQHIQEQISLINTIMRSVDAPELHSMINLLEKVQQNLLVTQHHEKEREDAKRP